MCYNGNMTTTNTTHEALQIEAGEMALQLINGNRSEVRQFIAEHETPTKLALSIVRHLTSMDADSDGQNAALLAVVNLQSLLEMVEV